MSATALRRIIGCVAVASLLADIWLCSLRCSSSPPIDWSRLTFAFAGQLLLIAVAILFSREMSDRSVRRRGKGILLLLVGMFGTLMMVRTSALLSDTISDKFFPSKGYECRFVRFGA